MKMELPQQAVAGPSSWNAPVPSTSATRIESTRRRDTRRKLTDHQRAWVCEQLKVYDYLPPSDKMRQIYRQLFEIYPDIKDYSYEQFQSYKSNRRHAFISQQRKADIASLVRTPGTENAPLFASLTPQKTIVLGILLNDIAKSPSSETIKTWAKAVEASVAEVAAWTQLELTKRTHATEYRPPTPAISPEPQHQTLSPILPHITSTPLNFAARGLSPFDGQQRETTDMDPETDTLLRAIYRSGTQDSTTSAQDVGSHANFKSNMQPFCDGMESLLKGISAGELLKWGFHPTMVKTEDLSK